MNEHEKSVMSIIEAYKQAVLDRDVDAFVSLYHENVRVFDAWGVWSYEGLVAWRMMIEVWFSSLGEEQVRVTIEDLQLLGTQDLSVASAFVTYTALSADGNELRSMQNRVTWTLKPESNSLKIAHEHTSAPISFEDSKAILQRGTAASSK